MGSEQRAEVKPMFVYTVYGVSAVNKGKDRRIGKISAVEPARAVTPSWRAQYGNLDQPQRVRWMRESQQEYVQAMAESREREAEPLAPASPRRGPWRNLSTEVSDMYLRDSPLAVVDQRKPANYTDVDLFRKYIDRLEQTRRQRPDD